MWMLEWERVKTLSRKHSLSICWAGGPHSRLRRLSKWTLGVQQRPVAGGDKRGQRLLMQTGGSGRETDSRRALSGALKRGYILDRMVINESNAKIATAIKNF